MTFRKLLIAIACLSIVFSVAFNIVVKDYERATAFALYGLLLCQIVRIEQGENREKK